MELLTNVLACITIIDLLITLISYNPVLNNTKYCYEISGEKLVVYD